MYERCDMKRTKGNRRDKYIQREFKQKMST
jgi:hypothetical protein